MTQRSVFISCGQRTADEKALGNDVAELVRTLTPFTPYFADTQTSLEGVSNHILRALGSAEGFVAILHRRGSVVFSGIGAPKPFDRASVWVEQEIAIASYLQHTRPSPIHVAVFVEEGIEREGLREHILLNPHSFRSSSDILTELGRVLPTWMAAHESKSQVHVEVTFKASHRELELSVHATNLSEQPLDDFFAEIEVPPHLVRRGPYYALELRGRPGVFRTSPDNLTQKRLYPHDRVRIFRLVLEPLASARSGDVVRVVFVPAGHSPIRVEAPVSATQKGA